MHPVVLLLAGGGTFFAGLALLLAAALVRRHATPRANRAAAWLAILAVGALAASATPLPPWAYVSLALPLALLPVATPARRGRAVVAAASAAAILAVGLHEALQARLPVLRPADDRRIAIIGDSLTAGHGDDDRATTWPALLERRHGVAVENLARAGATAASALKEVRERPPEAPVVLVEIGGNDLLGGTAPGDFERALDALLGALDRPGRQVVMFELPLPPFHERYGRIQRRVAARHGVALIPERVLLEVLGGADATVDSIHLSQSGHERMAALVWRFLGPAFPAPAAARLDAPAAARAPDERLPTRDAGPYPPPAPQPREATPVSTPADTDRHDGAAPPGRRRLPRNVLILCTDQDRAVQHFPPGWAERNLRGLMRLKRHGLTFENAFTNSCMCSPARVTWMTGYFPAQHAVRSTLEEDMPSDQYPQDEMPVGLPNMATVMTAAGFHSIYKGKWHCSKPINGTAFTQADLAQYGFDRWNPPDGGADQSVGEGGGAPSRPGAHDERFMHGDGPNEESAEGILAFLRSDLAKQAPFFMVASLVNPHDVLAYPTNFEAFGYTEDWLEGEIDLPSTAGEDLSTKPSAQRQFLALSAGLGPLPTPQMKRNYLNFYGNLLKLSDRHICEILDTLEREGLMADTLIIRTADHGEMGMTHGGMRQKNFNFYEESLRIPLVYSNPLLYPEARSSEALVSHVDFLPTLASLYGAPPSARAPWQGVDYSRVILDPTAAGPQDHIVFTFDDYLSGQATKAYPRPNNRVVSIREVRWKLAEYYDPSGEATSEWEMYDLAADPTETDNLARPGYERTPVEQQQYERLRRKLEETKRERLQPLA